MKRISILSVVTQQLQDPADAITASPGKATLSRSSSGAGLISSIKDDWEASFLSYYAADGEMVTLELKGKQLFTFGRQPTSDICINTPTCSRNHATLLMDENGRAWVEKMSDTNVVKVNGTKISAPAMLSKGDVIEVGGTLLSFGEQASSSSAMLSRRKSKMTLSEVYSIAVPGVEADAEAEAEAEAEAKAEAEGASPVAQGNQCVSPTSDDYDTASTERAAGSSPDSCSEELIVASVGSDSSPHGSRLLARKIRSQQVARQQMSSDDKPPSCAEVDAAEVLEEKEEGTEERKEGAEALSAVTEEDIVLVVGTASSPYGSKLLARKIMAQRFGRQMGSEAGHSCGSPSSAANQDKGQTEQGIQLWEAMKDVASSHSKLTRTRAAYNRSIFSPSMGMTEAEHRMMQQDHLSRTSTASASPPSDKVCSSPSCHTAVASPQTPQVLQKTPSSSPATGDHLASAKGSRMAYNQLVYSPSMVMTEEEVNAHRAMARASQVAVDASIAEEEEEQAECDKDTAAHAATGI